MQAEILCIGTELLIGQTVNTNATWLARELALLGIDLHLVTTVGDNFARLQACLAAAASRADLVICTGGLGPTADDITVEAIARWLGEPLAERPEEVERIAGMMARRGRQLSALDRKQALFPPSATLLPNPWGTASGLSVERAGCTLMAFPGVPRELEAMWHGTALPWLAACATATIRSHLLRFVGLREAELAERVADLMEGQNPTVAPYAHDGEVHLRLTAKAGSEAEAEALLSPILSEIARRLGRHCFGEGATTLPAAIGERLRARGEWVSTAESCTGGLLASRLTDVPGASRWFASGAIPYSDAQKAELLGVDPELVRVHGAVSPDVAEAMATAVRQRIPASWGVGITGYAGGDPPGEQDGLVYVGISGPSGTWHREFRFTGYPRERVKWFAANSALAELWSALRDRT